MNRTFLLTCLASVACPAAVVIAQAATWEPVLTLGERLGHAMAEDPIRDRIVLFTGVYSSRLNVDTQDCLDTWEWDGTRWIEQRPRVSPPGRYLASMTYDHVRRTVVMFGGVGHATYQLMNDMWEWDGQNWREIPQTATWPPVRAAHAMASDPQRGRILMFGGLTYNSVGYLQDTWEWDGVQWSERFPQTVPFYRADHQMAWCGANGRTMMFGGGVGTLLVADPCYEWDGNDWILLPNPPPGRRICALVGMPWNGHILLHNLVRLVSASSVSTLPDTWQYDGANWTPVPTTNWPGFRFRPAMAPLSSRQHVVFYGGDFDGPTGGNEPVSRSPSPDPLDKPWSTWTYANGNWQRESHLPGPVKPAIIAAAVDTARDRTVLLVDGGWPDRSMSYFQTWVLEGETMRQLPVTNHPPFRDMPTLGYHPGLDRIVMFGGYYLLRDTWVFDGSTWTQDPNPSQPITGNGAGNMYYDPHRSALVLTQNGRSEVWEWRGAGWTERVEARLPAAFNGRWDVVTGFDPVRQRLIACGGSLGVTGNAQDTWEFDGTTWSLVPTAVLPPTPFLPRRLVHVSWLDRMVVIPRQPPWGLLQYDGTTWSPLATERELYNGLAPLQNSHRFPVCYDDKRGELRVLTQTLDYGLVGSQIWNLVSRTLVPTTHQPRLGERLGFGFDLPTRPHAFCLLGLSGDLFPGIDVGAADGRIVPLANDGLFQISLQLGLFTWLDAQGRGSVQLAPIPTNPNLLGMLLHAAGAVLDPATGWVGTVTNRVAIRVAP